VFLPGLKVINKSTQINRIEIMHTGIEMKNHATQEGAGCIFSKAMMFWGDAIGEAIPPIFEAKAIPRISAWEKGLFAGRFRKRGWMMEKHNTGAATFEIHMEANMATNMLVTRTVRGRVPARERTKVAIRLAMPYLLSAAAIANPPRRSMITGVHMAEKMYLVAAFVSNRS
jgi:hypothetical protein